ncbi:hypothetical protein VNO80_15783 [Phaseolus coccineus]|uniref:Uncharacterized protein n=1 Tax=Phaseolus coccineus TaxID=3886 RepID=A0AAN9QZJ2_PHACN
MFLTASSLLESYQRLSHNIATQTSSWLKVSLYVDLLAAILPYQCSVGFMSYRIISSSKIYFSLFLMQLPV